MRFLASIFVPTGNRRLNELIGFLLCVSALLLFLALASYSPLDPSLNSASVLTGTHVARNWIGVVGAVVSDLALQFFGIGAFLLPIFFGVLGIRWFASRKIQSPVAKSLGGVWLIVFTHPCVARAAARKFALAECDPNRRYGRASCRRRADSLPEPRRSVHRVRQRAGGCALSLDGVFVFGDPALGSDAICVCHSTMEPLPGLAGGTDQAAAAEGTGQAPEFEAGGENAVNPIAAKPCRTRGPGASRAGTSTYGHRAHARA